MTILDAIIQSLSRDDQAGPAVEVWPDKGPDWSGYPWGEDRDGGRHLRVLEKGRIRL